MSYLPILTNSTTELKDKKIYSFYMTKNQQNDYQRHLCHCVYLDFLLIVWISGKSIGDSYIIIYLPYKIDFPLYFSKITNMLL